MEINKIINSLPDNPGIYIYKNKEGQIIYVGKAVNLSKRVKQYFQRDDAVGLKTPQLVAEINSIDTIQTHSEFDALLLEAKLIKEYQPRYNIISKDDKSPLYVFIDIRKTLPTITVGRKTKKELSSNITDDQWYTFGPFQSAKTARNLLRSLRKIVPYCTQKQRNGRACFYTHLGLCSPCPSYIEKLDSGEEKNQLTNRYRHHIFRLRDILSGKSQSVILEMEQEMERLSSQHNYEEAASIRNQLLALRSLVAKRYDPAVYVQSDTLLEEIRDTEQKELLQVLQQYIPTLTSLQRIECYDISNTQGTYATASMVVMTDGLIDKSQYRKFRMRTKEAPNDYAMIHETLSRRLRHTEWQLPNLIVIDGGKGQVKAAIRAQSQHNELRDIPIIGLAKREEEIIVPVDDGWKVIRLAYSNTALHMLQKLRDEAHRFAKQYHTVLRSKSVT